MQPPRADAVWAARASAVLLTLVHRYKTEVPPKRRRENGRWGAPHHQHPMGAGVGSIDRDGSHDAAARANTTAGRWTRAGTTFAIGAPQVIEFIPQFLRAATIKVLQLVAHRTIRRALEAHVFEGVAALFHDGAHHVQLFKAIDHRVASIERQGAAGRVV